MFFGLKGSRGAHSNCLIYDTKTKSLERFEPNGMVSFYKGLPINWQTQ